MVVSRLPVHIQKAIGDAAGFHSPDMAKPAEAPLAENGKHALHVGTIQVFWGNFVLPLDVQNASQAPQEKAVEFPLLACVRGPCLAAVEEYTEHAGLVDVHVHFGLHGPLLQSGHNCCCLGNPAVHLCINGERAGDGGPEVGEVLHSFQVVTINGDGWRMVSALRHDVCLLQTNGQTKLLTGVGEAAEKLLQAAF